MIRALLSMLKMIRGEVNMKLGYVIIYVPDVAATVAFYERAFGVTRRFAHESGQYAEMETGATALAFAAEELVSSTRSEFPPQSRPRTPRGRRRDRVRDGRRGEELRACARGRRCAGRRPGAEAVGADRVLCARLQRFPGRDLQRGCGVIHLPARRSWLGRPPREPQRRLRGEDRLDQAAVPPRC